MTASGRRFVDWLAERLARAGTRRAFGVPGGGGSLDLIASLRRAGIDTQVTAREDAAVIMAGVSGLLAHAPGVAFTTKGPGLASAGNGLASAALDRMPALLVSEGFEKEELGYLSHQVFDQQELVLPLVRAGEGVVLSPDATSVEAWLAQTGSPAVLLAAGETMTQPVSDSGVPVDAARTDVAAAEIAEAGRLLARYRRPVVIIGLEAARRGISGPLQAFVGGLGAPVLTTYMARGCVPDASPLFGGIFTGGAIEQSLVRQADLIVLAGLDPVELIRKPWSYDAPVLEICTRVYEPHYLKPLLRLAGPLAPTLNALSEQVGGCGWALDEIARLRDDFIAGMGADGDSGLSATNIVKTAAQTFAGVPRLTVDAGAHMFSACAFWPCGAPYDLLISNGLASMGFALPAALAAAAHEPRRGALAMTGDGGLMMCLGELKTAAELAANVCIIVFNDGRLSLIDIKREERQFPDIGMSWSPPDFAAVARGFGLQAWRVEEPDDLRPALMAAAQQQGPRLVDVRVDARGYNAQLKALRG